MAFSTLVFPFVFLPVSLILYFVLPKRLKNAALVVCSLVFFAWGTPEYLVLMVLDIAFHYFAGRELAFQKARGRSGRFVLVSSVLVNLLLLGFFKYYGFLVDNLNALLGTALRARELPMPIGVSFFTFSLLSYLFDVYRDRAPAARNMLDFSLYVTFFPKLVSGPSCSMPRWSRQLRDPPRHARGLRLGRASVPHRPCKEGPAGQHARHNVLRTLRPADDAVIHAERVARRGVLCADALL